MYNQRIVFITEDLSFPIDEGMKKFNFAFVEFIENHFSEELKIQLKALMALHSRENYLKRYLDKYEKGLFPAVHYIDWQEKAKDFISKDFQKTFGRQRALEYIQVLDRILFKEVNVLNIL